MVSCSLKSTSTPGRERKHHRNNCLTAAANQNTNLTHSRAWTANQSSTMDMFSGQTRDLTSEQIHNSAWASPPGEQSDPAAVTEMDSAGLEKEEEEKVEQMEELEFLSLPVRLFQVRKLCRISSMMSQKCCM